MRLYNGCPDSELQAIWDERNRLKKILRALRPGAHCAYFPVEGEYHVHEWGYPISGFRQTQEGALCEAITFLGGNCGQ